MTLFPNIFITNQGIYGQEKSLYFVGQTGMFFWGVLIIRNEQAKLIIRMSSVLFS